MLENASLFTHARKLSLTNTKSSNQMFFQEIKVFVISSDNRKKVEMTKEISPNL